MDWVFVSVRELGATGRLDVSEGSYALCDIGLASDVGAKRVPIFRASELPTTRTIEDLTVERCPVEDFCLHNSASGQPTDTE